jgi:hypothetical protein
MCQSSTIESTSSNQLPVSTSVLVLHYSPVLQCQFYSAKTAIQGGVHNVAT